MGSKKGFQNGDHKMHFFAQVITYFSWSNGAIAAAAAAKKEALVVNCDETAIAFTHTGRKRKRIKKTARE